ncbi:MAG TPA: N-acetylglucosamine-6-phosphate deacetylase [Jiangellaceae bacterium]|nr:N-acetylglucosamine-6-phosphate deacetylase [Jiangellaceae bacterium]
MAVLAGGRLVTPDGVLENGWLRTAGRTIAAVGSGAPPGPADLDVAGAWVVPGFVDIHVHGGGGASYLAGDPQRAAAVASLHRRHGTTTTLASLVTAEPARLARAVAGLAEVVDDGLLAGIHLEGPFLAAERRGAHDPALLTAPEPGLVDMLLTAGRGTVRMVTLAPELPHGVSAVRRLADAGVVAAVGHTDATYEQTRTAIDAGATVATHLFNAMRPLHHREPGPIAALLEDDRVTVELICDGVHLHPAVVRTAIAATGADRVTLVTDAMDAAGAGDGDYDLGGLAVRVTGGTARLVDGGAIAGSTLTMDRAVKFVLDAGTPMPAAVRMASTTPARLLGLADQVGELRAGLDADLVVLDADFVLRAVMSKGTWVDGA